MRIQRTGTAGAARVGILAAAILPFVFTPPSDASEKGHAGHGDAESAAGHSHAMSEIHGGTATMTPHFHFETLFTETDVRVWVYDGKQAPLADPKGGKAAVTLQTKQGNAARLDMTFMAPDPAQGRAQGYFAAAYDFAAVGRDAMKAIFRIEGLSEQPEEFRTPVLVASPAVYSCPMHPDVKSPDPGKCSKCGMRLERVAAPGAAHESGARSHEGSGHTH